MAQSPFTLNDKENAEEEALFLKRKVKIEEE
jgi:hypothetical protein